MAHRALHTGALVALTVTALTAAPAALGQPSPDPAPAAPTPAPDPAPSAPAPPAQPVQPPAPVAPSAPAPAPTAPTPVQAPAPTSSPSTEEPAAPAREQRARPRTSQRAERREPRKEATTADDQPSIARAAFLRVESLLPRGETSDDSSDTMLLLAAGGLLALVLASGSFTSVIARLMPPTAVMLLLLAAPTSAQAQSITPNCDTPGGGRDTCSHWYTASRVSLSWTLEPSGGEHVSGCQITSFTAETAPAFRQCKWSWSGSTYTVDIWIGIDRTAPKVTGIQPGRLPDHGAWFNHPVSLSFKGTDALSGVQDCSGTTFGGPEGADVLVAGSCTDVAGNTGNGMFPVNYDSVAPPAPEVLASPRDGSVGLEWTPAADAEAEIVRSTGNASTVVYRGNGHSFTDGDVRNGERYRYVVTLMDQAGNRAAGSATAVPTASPLFTPSTSVKLSKPPLLTWRKVRRASYYNVQLFRGKRKILSRWPRTNEFQLKRRWRYAGRVRRLAPGRYCYVVWPGFGRPAKRNYGRQLGRRCFRITA